MSAPPLPCRTQADLLPSYSSAYGPITRLKLLRTLSLYLALAVSGIALIESATNVHLRVFGLGMLWPGAGFLAHAGLSSLAGWAHIGLCGVMMLLFGGALLLWLATGNAVAPPLVWLLAAMSAAAMDHGAIREAAVHAVYGIFAAAILLLAATFIARRQRFSCRRAEANAWLASVRGLPAGFHYREEGKLEARELDAADLHSMRFVLDRALQPIEAFNGFQRIDQFQTSALRYQLSFMGYALSMLQAARLPACGAYLDTAQHKLILKQAHPDIWAYWRHENRWGNLRNDPNPLMRENIMYSGFCALQMAMFHLASGRIDFLAPGTFAPGHADGRSYPADLPGLALRLQSEFARSDLRLAACEPNWVYPLCNCISGAALKLHDAKSWNAWSDPLREALEREFMTADGRLLSCRSNRTGLALPATGGALPQALSAFFMNALWPSLALRHWLLLRRDLLSRSGLKRNAFWRVDTGDYRRSRAGAYAGVALAAREFGDMEIAELCMAALDVECPRSADGSHRPLASVWSHALELLARAADKNAFCDFPALAPQTPRLHDIPYPEVLVAQAYARDGALHAVFLAGAEPGRRRIVLSGMIPHARYVCVGGVERLLHADAAGRAGFDVDLDVRREVLVHPLFR